VLRIDARNPDNSVIAAQFGLRMTPTSFIFDQHAAEQYRSTGSINRGQFDGFVAGITRQIIIAHHTVVADNGLCVSKESQ
jgi:hypothetical protein